MGYSALKREYDEEGNWISQTYLDDKLNPFMIRSGYASIHRTYNSIGKVETEMFFDADGLPAPDANRRYGYRNEYDADGRMTAVICLDSNGNVINNVDRYAIVRKTYYSDGKLRTEMYYAQDSNPARLRNGQYGLLYINGKPICLDKDGNKIFVLRHFLLHSPFVVLLVGILLLLLIMLMNRCNGVCVVVNQNCNTAPHKSCCKQRRNSVVVCVRTFPVVPAKYIFNNACIQLFCRLESMMVCKLVLQRIEESFHRRIVIRTGRSAHALLNVIQLTEFCEVF